MKRRTQQLSKFTALLACIAVFFLALHGAEKSPKTTGTPAAAPQARSSLKTSAGGSPVPDDTDAQLTGPDAGPGSAAEEDVYARLRHPEDIRTLLRSGDVPEDYPTHRLELQRSR